MKFKQKLTAGITLINKRYKKKEFYHYFEEPNNVILIPIVKSKFLLVKQKRVPINERNFEFPMGWMDKDETSLNASKRELLEETGYKSLKNPKKLIQYFADPGRAARTVTLFYSNKLKKIQKPEKNIQIYFKSRKEIENLIKNKKFNNSLHIAAFYFYIYNF